MSFTCIYGIHVCQISLCLLVSLHPHVYLHCLRYNIKVSVFFCSGNVLSGFFSVRRKDDLTKLQFFFISVYFIRNMIFTQNIMRSLKYSIFEPTRAGNLNNRVITVTKLNHISIPDVIMQATGYLITFRPAFPFHNS